MGLDSKKPLQTTRGSKSTILRVYVLDSDFQYSQKTTTQLPADVENLQGRGPVAIAIGWIAASTKAAWISSGATSNIAPMLWRSGSFPNSAPCAPGIFATSWAAGIRTRIWHGQMLRFCLCEAGCGLLPRPPSIGAEVAGQCVPGVQKTWCHWGDHKDGQVQIIQCWELRERE